MLNPPLSVLAAGWQPIEMQALAAQGLALHETHDPLAPTIDSDAVLLQMHGLSALQALRDDVRLPGLALEQAWVLVTELLDPVLEVQLLQRGIESILPPMAAPLLARQLHHAVQRKRLERAARTAYATDLATGLPHQAQLVEHMTQLLALREREPAPMVLLVLRVDGFAQAAAKLGAEAGNVLRRKVAVRLRSLLRASDVVAAIGPDAFGVLLGRLEQKTDGEQVAGKLVRSLQQPILVAGQPCTVAAAVGLALYPEHGKDANSLLQRASAQAGSVATLGASGFASLGHRGSAAAANDEGA